MSEKKTIRSVIEIVGRGGARAILAEDADPFKEGDEILLLKLHDDGNQVFCRTFESFPRWISLDTKIE